MNPDHDSWDEEQFEALLCSADNKVAPPDRQRLDRLRQESLEAFTSAGSEQPPTSPSGRSTKWIATRWAAAVLAASIVIGIYLTANVSSGKSPVTFGKVLDKTAQANTLHLRITRDGKTSDVWTRRPSQLRWEEGPGIYKIARGERAWRVDEKANRASAADVDYFRPGTSGVDALALLEIASSKERETLSDKKPGKPVKLDGVDCYLYQMQLRTEQGLLLVEAVADARTGILRSLAATAGRGERAEPIVRLTLVSVNKPTPQEKFIVGDTLTEDGRIGKIIGAQGIVSVKPVMHSRWTPAGSGVLLKPGDWVRTDIRGANVAAMRLIQQTRVTVGPGTLVELSSPKQIRLLSGVLKVSATEQSPLVLLGPGDQAVTVCGPEIYRLEKEKLARVKQSPLWLQGFEGTASDESIGSLVVQVDGRDVPLTVGYHKVTVDIRDQIARTVIEESFVNHTDRRLEGVFYFPLPQDASISGFGMWIGDELVEADVVEKQRARQIYETILRERRDSGLLEWTGGNIFKARVFPIFAHSEKRIKITYTQVLPLRGDRYRYSYALQSELLKQHPLRELAIDVKVSSTAPLVAVSSPTHTAARVAKTKHSGHVEFSAQQYTPSRDFEVVVQPAGGRPEVVMTAHRRGDDGYFMIQLSPPIAHGGGRRDMLPDGEPLELLVLADTSASLDNSDRQTQAALVASLLSSLTPKDKFNLAVCDVSCRWAFDKPVPAQEANIHAARQLLDEWHSLGWTDLDKAFTSVLAQCTARTHVVYVGDGILTTGDADPVAFGRRLRRRCAGKAAAFHAVSLSSSFEPLVLKAIASIGGGSLRAIGTERGPQAVAVELLGEMTRPVLRDVKVELKGFRTARVYPEDLPNVAAGTQLILLGRYLPTGDDQRGEVVVTGRRGGEPVRMVLPVSLQDAQRGNSFIPRMWARMYLEALLAQGASTTIKDQIVALSEEYHIMTPYTSFLVLESDEDRERFGVKRRFQMRDAEKFFAEGRGTANYELVQQQIKRAGQWRIGLRRGILRQLWSLGRDVRQLDPRRFRRNRSQSRMNLGSATKLARGGGLPWDGPVGSSAPSSLPFLEQLSSMYPDFDFEEGGFGGGGGFGSHSLLSADRKQNLGDLFESDEESERYQYFEASKEIGGPHAEAFDAEADLGKLSDMDYQADRSGIEYPKFFKDGIYGGFGNESHNERTLFIGYARNGVVANQAMSARPWFRRSSSRREPRDYSRWLNTLFPALPPKPSPKKSAKPEIRWPNEARTLAESLLRTRHLAEIKGGLQIIRTTESFQPRWDKLTSRSELLGIVSPRS